MQQEQQQQQQRHQWQRPRRQRRARKGGGALGADVIPDGTHIEAWLLGQPPMRDYLDFVRDTALPGEEPELGRIADEWREANDYYHQLEQREKGIADYVEELDLPAHLAPLAAELTAHPNYQRAFNVLPTRVALVELDRLVVSQRSVSATFVAELVAQLGAAPDPESLFRACLPLRSRRAPVQVQQVGSRRWVFRSESTDLRFHEPVLLDPEQVPGYPSFGTVAGIVGLVVGFGSNLLNAVRVEDRLLLQNGYHRACALRSLGLTHAPCVVQTVTRPDELELAVKDTVAEDPELYLDSARPPLLKDYFDPCIRKLLPVRRQVRLIELTFEVQDHFLSE